MVNKIKGEHKRLLNEKPEGSKKKGRKFDVLFRQAMNQIKKEQFRTKSNAYECVMGKNSAKNWWLWSTRRERN